eukprot:570840-Pelagomonas_calceolata.AAC.2
MSDSRENTLPCSHVMFREVEKGITLKGHVRYVHDAFCFNSHELISAISHVCIAMLQKSKRPCSLICAHVIMRYQVHYITDAQVALEHSASGCLETPDTLLEIVRPQYPDRITREKGLSQDV